MNTLKNLLLICLAVFTLSACDDDSVELETGTFELRIENIQTSKPILASGETGFLMPGESETFTFHAGQGHYLSFATMFVQSNDLFFGPEDTGLSLYDANGNAITGDVTNEILLWDAGTEVNEAPGIGPNQAPRQSGPNTGTDENGTVEPIDDINDGYVYPATSSLIKLSLEHDGGTQFTATITNTSSNSTLPSPLAPGVWAVHSSSAMLFTEGELAPIGLEGVAEDGTNQEMLENVAGSTGYASPLAPGVWAVHGTGTAALFDAGQKDRGAGLEALAEDGAVTALAESTASLAGVLSSGIFDTPDGESDPGPLMGGSSYVFTFEAEEGDYLNFATMLIQSNDLFFAFGEGGINLFPNGSALSGDITGQISLWDAGTEVNEYPGAGNNQPIRGGGNSGPAEDGNVRLVDDAFTYPAVNELIRVTISQR